MSLPSGLHTNTDILFHVIQQLLSSSVSPVLSSLLRIVQQNSDDVEEAAEHFEGKVKHSHSQTCNAKRTQSKTQTITVEKKKRIYYLSRKFKLLGVVKSDEKSYSFFLVKLISPSFFPLLELQHSNNQNFGTEMTLIFENVSE